MHVWVYINIYLGVNQHIKYKGVNIVQKSSLNMLRKCKNYTYLCKTIGGIVEASLNFDKNR